MSKLSDAMTRLFDSQRVGKGVKKGIDLPKNLTNFFKYYKLHFSEIFKVNMLLILGNFPFFFGLYAMTGNLNYKVSSAASSLFPHIYGAMLHQNGASSPAAMALYGVHGVQDYASVMTTATYVLFALTALLIFTVGSITVAATYLFRNLMKGEPLFFWQDVKYSIKRNLGQGFLVGFLDCLFFFLFSYNILFSYINSGSSMTSIVFYGNIALAILYLLMRPYMYITLITFKLNVFKIFKNSFIFAIIGGKRNIAGLLGSALVIAVNYACLIFFMPLGICLPLFITVGTVWYINIYTAFPKIKEIMIDPYVASASLDGTIEHKDEETSIFHDDVSEK